MYVPSGTTKARRARLFQNSASHHWIALCPQSRESGYASRPTGLPAGTTLSIQSRTRLLPVVGTPNGVLVVSSRSKA